MGIPKTMDNDVLWVWQSFGFNTAVERATEVVNTMHSEAESTRRVSIIELFGAESGFVAANAALASGHVNLVVVPESFLLQGERTKTDSLGKVRGCQLGTALAAVRCLIRGGSLTPS